MTLAITADVRRWLDETEASAPGIVLQPFLDAAAELIKEKTGRDWDTVGTATDTFPSVRQGDLLKLKDENPTGVTVTVYLTPADAGRQLQAAEYSLAPHGRLRLRYDAGQFAAPSPVLLTQQRRGLGEALASIDARPVTYDRAVVAYTASGDVPARVREATACTAAALYRQRGQVVAGIESEKIGDYSYTRRKKDEKSPDDAIPPEALALLGNAKAPAQVIF
jgi:hypothetical protein